MFDQASLYLFTQFDLKVSSGYNDDDSQLICARSGQNPKYLVQHETSQKRDGTPPFGQPRIGFPWMLSLSVSLLLLWTEHFFQVYLFRSRRIIRWEMLSKPPAISKKAHTTVSLLSRALISSILRYLIYSGLSAATLPGVGLECNDPLPKLLFWFNYQWPTLSVFSKHDVRLLDIFFLGDELSQISSLKIKLPMLFFVLLAHPIASLAKIILNRKGFSSLYPLGRKAVALYSKDSR